MLPGRTPMYDFPADVAVEIRQRYLDSNAGARDANYTAATDNVYMVTWDDLGGSKWQQPPKSCSLCSKSGKKPY